MRALFQYGIGLAVCCVLCRPSFAQLFGITSDPGGALYSISTIDASVKFIGNTGLNQPDSLEFGPDGRLYSTTNGLWELTSELYSINLLTAEATLVGPTGVEQYEGALAFAPDGTAYGGLADNATIYSIDLDTGAATTLGSVGAHDINGMAFRSDGAVIAFEGVPFGSSLFSIDLATLATTKIATIPTLHGIGGMAVYGNDAYLIGRRLVDQVDSLFRIDLYTGATSLIGKIDLAGSFFGSGRFSGLAATQVPEPTWTAAAIVATFCFCFPRRRKIFAKVESRTSEL